MPDPRPPEVIHSEILDLNADCAEFCPVPGLTNLLALGTYQLLEEQQERVGKCYLVTLERGGPGGAPSGSRLVSSLDLPGVFDLKWKRPVDSEHQQLQQRSAWLGAALADGTVRVLEATTADCTGSSLSQSELRQVGKVAACDHGMCLSLDWRVESGGSTAEIASSSSSGTLSLIQATASGITLISEWKAHSLEVWCAAFHRVEKHILFSGADDCYFRAFDTRSSPSKPVFSDRRTHTAGVCTVSPHPTHSHIVATGSYDEHVRLWDMRNISKPLITSELNTGGGNWRLRWHPHQQQALLAACMYNGFAVLHATDSFDHLGLVGMYLSPNTHVAYGADWWQEPWDTAADGTGQKGDVGQGRALAATCSFYDRMHTLVWLDIGP